MDARLFRSADPDNENDDEEEEEEEDAEKGEGNEGDGFSNGKGERVGRVKKPPPLRVRFNTRQRLNADAVGGKSRWVRVPVRG